MHQITLQIVAYSFHSFAEGDLPGGHAWRPVYTRCSL